MVDSRRVAELVQIIRYSEPWECTDAIDELEDALPGSDIMNLCQSDYPDETIVEIVLSTPEIGKELNLDELTVLIEQFRAGAPTEGQSIVWALKFEANCQHRAGLDLLLDPTQFLGGEQVTARRLACAALGLHDPEQTA